MPTPLELMQRHAQALYTFTLQGRLRHVAEVDAAPHELEPAPRLFMGRTAEGNVWHVRHDLPDGLLADLDELCRREGPLTPQEPQIAAQVRSRLAPLRGEWRGPAYWLPPTGLSPANSITASAVVITRENAGLLSAHFPRTQARAQQGTGGPVTAIVSGGQAVCVCSCARLSAHVAEAGVHTLEGHRGQGYAPAAVALWAELLRHQGILPLYSTSGDNLASQAVARRLGAVQYGEDWSIE